MSKIEVGDHISQQFNTELEDIRQRVLAMGGLVEKQLANAIEALTNRNMELAEVVVTNDYKINALEVAIDEECNQILALRQPAASDLRLVVAVIKTIADLERVGDESERIGRMALQLSKSEASRKLYGRIEPLGRNVQRMLHDALDAFARTDVDAAVHTWEQDYKVDEEYEGVIRQLITFMMEDPRSIPSALDVMWSARALERIGDRSRNICEYIIYLVHGRDVRHTSLEQMQAAARAERGE